MMHTGRRAFTLVELLVVIGIIAVLISILLPTLNRARAAASRTQCLSNQRQLMTAVAMYQNRFRGALPPFIVGGNPGASHRLYDPQLIGANTKNAYQGWVMLGMLYGTGIIVKTPAASDPPPFMFYCPVQTNSLLKYPEGWYSGIKRGGYAYRLSMDPYGNPIGPFVTTKDLPELRSAARGRFKRILSITSDIVYADAGFGPDMTVWSHDRPPHVIAGYSDGHAESVPIPEPVYRLSTQKINPGTQGSILNKSDAMCLGIFKACDTKDFKQLETWLKSIN
jgi:prepilin-type N-terminal cleavage/methylation domain-containing protein